MSTKTINLIALCALTVLISPANASDDWLLTDDDPDWINNESGVTRPQNNPDSASLGDGVVMTEEERQEANIEQESLLGDNPDWINSGSGVSTSADSTINTSTGEINLQDEDDILEGLNEASIFNVPQIDGSDFQGDQVEAAAEEELVLNELNNASVDNVVAITGDDFEISVDDRLEAEIERERLLNEFGGDNVRDVDQEACGVWLCLPIGFTHPACNGPRREMIRRLLNFDPPAPSWSSCTASPDSDNDGFEIVRGRAALVPPDRIDHSSTIGCNIRDGELEEPRGCVETVKHYTVTQHGKPFGTTYYRIGGGTLVDRREHCDVALEDRHPSCFDTSLIDADSQEAQDMSPATLFNRVCPERYPNGHRHWCFEHSETYCVDAAVSSTTYCVDYYDWVRRREENSDSDSMG